MALSVGPGSRSLSFFLFWETGEIWVLMRKKYGKMITSMVKMLGFNGF